MPMKASGSWFTLRRTTHEVAPSSTLRMTVTVPSAFSRATQGLGSGFVSVVMFAQVASNRWPSMKPRAV